MRSTPLSLMSLKSRSIGSKTVIGADSEEFDDLPESPEQERITEEINTENKINLRISLVANGDFSIMKYRLIPVYKDVNYKILKTW